jgi:hypothetical protein
VPAEPAPAVPLVPTIDEGSSDRTARLLSPLAALPDWSELDRFQETMTRDEFVRLLDQVYTRSRDHESFITVHATHATVTTSSLDPGRVYTIRFAPPGTAPAPSPLASGGRALDQLTIAIDPGHIGGQWARTESRWFRIGDSEPVAEGDLNLRVAHLLAGRLREHGARVVLVRSEPRPVTDASPRDLEPLARAQLVRRGELHGGLSPARTAQLIEQESVLLAYRTSEIHARARLVNERIKPDLTICVHFDAAAWKRPGRPSLTDDNHLHAIVHGSYTADELVYEDMRFHLLHKLLSRDHEVELALTRSVVQSMALAMELPPEDSPESAQARRMSDDGYIWARNLLANRLYRGPVLYLEPYVMNNRDVFARIQAGDYPGLRHIAGKRRPSIFREYADAVTRGLVEHAGHAPKR